MEPKTFTLQEWEETILELDEDADYGYIFDVNLEYPKELYEDHKDLP